jgi:hypothetical protein
VVGELTQDGNEAVGKFEAYYFNALTDGGGRSFEEESVVEQSRL